MIPRPTIVKPEHLAFLDQLREQGTINMFGASQPLAEAFELPIEDARTIHVYWMQSFSERKDDGAFDNWMARVNKVLSRYGVHSDDLADCSYRDWFDEGMEPAEAAVEAIRINRYDEEMDDDELDSSEDFYRGGIGYDL